MRVSVRLCEHMTFDQLFRVSDPRRVARSFTVHGPPLEIDSYQDAAYYVYNFKSNPSTTGLRHRGYIKYLRPANAKATPLQHLNCVVDCTCPDFRYRWAWANKQRQASKVGPNSLNQAWNRAPRKTNPTGAPGLCKHLLACREYIYGLLSSFSGDEPDTAEKLNKLTRYAQKRWTNHSAQVRAAKERERVYKSRRDLRNRGIDPDAEAKVSTAPTPEPPPEPETLPEPLPEPLDAVSSEASTLAAPVPEEDEPLREPGTVPPGYRSWAEYDFARRQGLGDSLARERRKPATGRVVNENGEPMTNLHEAKNLVEEMIDELPETGIDTEQGDGVELTLSDDSAGLPPSEPPVSDSAIGADTEGATALGLLTQIRDLLGALVTTHDADAQGAAAAPAAPDMSEEATDAIEMPDEPPAEDDDFEGVEEDEGEEEEEGGAKSKSREPKTPKAD